MKKNINLLITVVISIVFINALNVNAENDLVQNSNIVKMYQYNQTSSDANYCITGEESTCTEITNLDTLASGTIIKYKVNDTDIVTFHVMYDNGSTLTMQAQENTINNIAWISAEDYAKANTDGTTCEVDACGDEGPITVLASLENVTGTWKNVNNQTYEMGTTIFIGDNSYTSCIYEGSLDCSSNKYTLPSRTAKARMITMQEANDLGCTTSTNSCPAWMYNYLDTENNDTTETATTGYWAMNSTLSYRVGGSYNAWTVNNLGGLKSNYPFQSDYGARAVVVVNKYNANDTSSESETTENNDQVVEVEDTAWNVSKIGITIGLVILVLGVMVIVQTILKGKQKNQ